MYLTKEKKEEIFAQYGKSTKDTGSAEVQIALLTEEINALSKHLAANKHDYHSNRGLLIKVGRRKNLLKYLAKKDINAYRKVIKELGLRK